MVYPRIDREKVVAFIIGRCTIRQLINKNMRERYWLVMLIGNRAADGLPKSSSNGNKRAQSMAYPCMTATAKVVFQLGLGLDYTRNTQAVTLL